MLDSTDGKVPVTLNITTTSEDKLQEKGIPPAYRRLKTLLIKNTNKQ